ncbi:MAG TPA: TlpA disulfide reductase family protein [Thermoanaerobaculia bacterium]|nr:TlpA disulfide reductase family protein [Thermoanaerobaculia bacterium]
MKKMAMAIALAGVLAGGCEQNEKPVADAKAKPAAQTRGAEPAETATTGVDVGATMPPYTATLLDGSKFDLAARRDKVVLLNLWATWCGPCRYEIPELQALHAKYGPRGFEVVGVSLDEGGAEDVKPFVEEQKMTYPIVLDPDGVLADIFAASVLPTSALVDRNGKVVWKHIGIVLPNDEKLTKAIEQAL